MTAIGIDMFDQKLSLDGLLAGKNKFLTGANAFGCGVCAIVETVEPSIQRHLFRAIVALEKTMMKLVME